MKYEIEYSDGILEVKTSGNAELQGFMDFIRDIVAHEHWQPDGKILINHTKLNADSLTSEDIEKMSDFGKNLQSKIGRAKIALVVPGDLQFGLSRMWQMFSSPGRESATELFRSRDKAVSWLKND